MRRCIRKGVGGAMKISFVIPPVDDASPVVCIDAEVCPSLDNEEKFLDALKKGVTEWVEKYLNGKVAQQQAAGYFNVGDLILYMFDADLQECLDRQGILKLEGHIPNNHTKTWTFETVLVE